MHYSTITYSRPLRNLCALCVKKIIYYLTAKSAEISQGTQRQSNSIITFFMLENILTTISSLLEPYLKNKLGLDYDNPVLISKLVNEDGSSTLHNVNAVVISLYNIQQENIYSSNTSSSGNRPVQLNFYLLFSACFTSRYLDSFNYLYAVISFFQTYPVLNHSNAPQLDAEINKLSFEIENLDTSSVSQLWGAIGAKHLPFVLYKIRMVTINEPTGGGASTFTSLR